MGPHSSGTRLLTRILNAGGFSGYHRSLPIDAWPEKLDGSPLVFIHRDRNATLCSNLWNGHASTFQEAEAIYEGAWQEMAAHVSTAEPLVVISYEELVQWPQWTIGVIADALGVTPWYFDEDIVDGNKKWEGVDPETVTRRPETTQTVFMAGRKV